ncbi:MAG TPA: HAD-IA family hydrolase [Nitrospiria bacterium]
MNLIGLDLDGTLEDSRADMVSAVHRVRAGLGLPARPDDAVRPWVNRGMEALYRACFDDYIAGVESRLQDVRIRYEGDYFENAAVETRLYPEMAGALDQLSQMGCLAVITNKPEKISIRLLEALGVDGHFSAVIGGDTCPKPKPDPVVLQEAVKRCGLKDGTFKSVMIGDTAADIQLGRAFGAETVWCAWGYSDEPGGNPDYRARTPSDLPGLVQAVFQTNG